MLANVLYGFVVAIYGLLIGSFLNVCIYRIPLNKDITTTRSHCRECGYVLKVYDLIPVFTYAFLRGRCRQCTNHISIQYPLVEGLNALIYLLIYITRGISGSSIIFMLLSSALIVLSIIDFRTYEIPISINIFIFCLGIVHTLLDLSRIVDYMIGFFAVSGFLYIIYFMSHGRGIGGGDIKLMAATGLILGYQNIILAFILACILGSIIHLIRMKISNEDKVLAFGPYLSMGIIISIIYGNQLIGLYLGMF